MNIEVFNLLLLKDEHEQISLIHEVIKNEGSNITLSIATDWDMFQQSITSGLFQIVVAYYPSISYSIHEALQLLTDNNPNIPLIIIADTQHSQDVLSLLRLGVADWVAPVHMERLPFAITNAIEKYLLKAEQEQYFNELIARKTLMKDAERLAHFGSWREDIPNNKLYWSDEKYRILGYLPGSIKPSWDYFYRKVHPEDVNFVKLTFQDTINSRNRQKLTFRILTENNNVKYIQSEIFVTRDVDLSVLQLNGFIRDISDHTEAEIRLVESEEKYRNLFENNPSALFVVDTDSNRFVDVNRTATLQYGYSRAEFLTMSTGDIITEKEFVLASQQGLSFPELPNHDGVWENRCKDGRTIQVEITTSDIIFDGRVSRLIMINDVTDKLLTINQLKESEARLITSQRIAHIGSWEVPCHNNNPDFSQTRWTDETYRIYGYSVDTLLTPELQRNIIHIADRTKVDDARSSATIDHREYEVEYRISLPNGDERILSELGEVAYNRHTGERLRISGTVQDITEKKIADEQLLQSEANLRSIFENTDTIYVLLDLQLNVVSFNKQAIRFAEKHFNKEINAGSFSISYFPAEVAGNIQKALEKAIKGKNLDFETSYPEPNGLLKWYYAHFHPVWSKEKSVLGVIMSFRDITERKTSELQEKKITEDLIKRNKDLEQFAYIISHNLRAPVANILGISEVLNNDEIDPEERQVFMKGLHDSIKKLDMVIIDLNRILQMKNEVNEVKERVQFSQIIDDIKFSISSVDNTEMYQIVADFSAVDEMTTLRSYIYSIFYNLISNSLKYKRPDVVPVVNVSSKITKDTLVLSFKDNGLGIDLEKNKQQIFGLYKRFHQQSAEGKGMGLFMVKTQVETLGGKIIVSSKVNHGTEFLIEFELTKE